ncbi:hypothetical protein F511_26841 [Dorcoceras hygrometricum]|uniref:Uncharacterized protein n=1 Tax=Dorcoceras hygrometricum TaxID=472368 RepID=A0A2Z7B8I5_9LAMI|nr:hypothetical protein F511_26841 [Dorcoceras hygrometricum]
MANQTTDDEVFDFSNSEFTREDLINTLNEMVHEYRKLSQTFEEIKDKNGCLKNSSVESRIAQLEDTDSLQTELSKLKIENDLLRLSQVMSLWTKSSVSLSKFHETQKPLNEKSGLGFSFGESSSEGTSTQSELAGEKFKKMNFVKASVIHDAYDSVNFRSNSAARLNDLCTRLESTSLDESSDDVPQILHTADPQPVLNDEIPTEQAYLTGNTEVIDLTNVDSIQEQISSSTQAASAKTTTAQVDTQADPRVHQLVSRPASYAQAINESHQVVSGSNMEQSSYQLVSDNQDLVIQPDIRAEQGANPIGSDLRTERLPLYQKL